MATPKQVEYLKSLSIQLGIVQKMAVQGMTVKEASLKIDEYKKALADKNAGVWDARIKSMQDAGVLPWEEGRYVTMGTIIGTKWVNDNYGTTLKVRVQDEDGRVLYMTAPKPELMQTALGSTDPEALVGRRVAVKSTVTLTQAQDPFFAIGMKPAWVRV